MQLFTPSGNTVSITTSTTSARVALGNSATVSTSVRVKNLDTSNAVFIKFGGSTVTASASADIPIGPGETAGFSVGPGNTYVAAVASTGTPVVYFTPGQGV